MRYTTKFSCILILLIFVLALERIRQDFLVDTQEAINIIQTRNSGSKENAELAIDQQQQDYRHQKHNKGGVCV